MQQDPVPSDSEQQNPDWVLVPSPAGIGTSIRNKLSSGTSYEEDVAEYDRKQVQSGVERVPEEPTE